METSINYPTSGLAVSRELVPSTSLTFIISLSLSFFQFNYEISSSGSIISLFVFQSSANVSFCLLQKRGHFSFWIIGWVGGARILGQKAQKYPQGYS